jgi:hypothetical protein
MALTAEQHSEIATAYEQYAADRFVPPEHRAEFAKKANWFRLAAKLAAKHPSRTKCPTAQEAEGCGSLGAAIGAARISPVPLPAALPLFISGLVGMGWLARRKKRMAAVAS